MRYAVAILLAGQFYAASVQALSGSAADSAALAQIQVIALHAYVATGLFGFPASFTRRVEQSRGLCDQRIRHRRDGLAANDPGRVRVDNCIDADGQLVGAIVAAFAHLYHPEEQGYYFTGLYGASAILPALFLRAVIHRSLAFPGR